MRGLIEFAEPIVPGSARVVSSVGDERNPLLLSVRGARGPEGAMVTLPPARLALVDEDKRIKSKQVVFFVVPD